MIKLCIVGPQEDKWKSGYQKQEAKCVIHALLFGQSSMPYRNWFDNRIEVVDDYLGNRVTDVVLVTGGCPKGGVDKWAEEVADKEAVKKLIFPPAVYQWEDRKVDGLTFKGYKSRNIHMAKICDLIYVIAPYEEGKVCYHHSEDPEMGKNHPMNGGCWTAAYARNLYKEAHLILIRDKQ